MTGTGTTRDLELTLARLTAYSRSGNFHSDPDAAEALGYTGMVAQGMQVAGPAYGILLERWGEDFLGGGTFETKFVGMVFEGATVTATCDIEEPTATFEVVEGERTVVVGSASLDTPNAPPGTDD